MRNLKLNQIKALFVAVLTGFAFSNSAFSQTNSEKKKEYSFSCHPEEEVKSAKVLFKKDKVYEIVFFSITEGKEKQIFGEYMPKAAPFFKKYGVNGVGMFNVIENRSKILQSTMVGIFEWPNYQAKENLEADKEFKKIAKLRNGSFSFFKGGWFTTKKDKEVTFYSNKVYEIVGASLFPTEEAQKTLTKYFEVSEPIKRNYGGSYPEFIVDFSPSDSKNTATYTHQMQLIVEWDNLEDNKKLFANEDFKSKALPLMKESIEKADFVFTTFIFNE